MSTLARNTQIAHYRIVRALGRGGMGEVYEAEDGSLDRRVAIKVLPPELVESPDRLRRFVHEAKSASALSHPHIVSIFEIGEATIEGRQDAATTEVAEPRTVHYIAMELIDGPTMGRQIEGDASLKELLHWLSQAASAIAKAHAAGIIHRDIKPDNIMVTSDGFAKVLDFGLAKLVDGPEADGSEAATALRDEATAEGVVMGTATYMSPEQARGMTVDHRSDIFSFGSVLYEATTRQRPFQGATSFDTMHQVLRHEPTDVHELNPAAPAALRRLIRRCMHKDPEQRLQSMKDLALHLTDLVDEFDQLATSSSAQPAISGPEAAVGGGRRRLGWGALAAVGIGVAAALGWMAAKDDSAAPSEPVRTPMRASFSQITSTPGVETRADIDPDGQFAVYTHLPKGARTTDIYLLRIGGRNPINLTEGSEVDDGAPAFSPDGQSIAFRSERDGGGIFVMGATGENVRRVVGSGYDPDWSPDGRKIVFAAEQILHPYARATLSTLQVVDVGTEEVTELYTGDAVMPRWSPDGRWIAFWGIPQRDSGQRDISIISADGGEPIQITDDPSVDWNPVWGAESDELFFVSDRGGTTTVWRIGLDPETGRASSEPEPLTTPARWSGFLAISGDGSRLLFTSDHVTSNLVRFDFDPERQRITAGPTTITDSNDRLETAAYSPDGEWIAYRSGAPREDLFIARADGSGIRQLTDDHFKDRGPSWWPDGSRVVFYSDRSGRYEIWSVRLDGSGLRQISETTGRSVWFPVVSPDGKIIAASNDMGGGYFTMGDDGIATGPTPFPKVDGRVFFPSDWSADGRTLYGGLGSGDSLLGTAVASFDRETETLTVLAEREVNAWAVRLLRDELHLLLASDRIYVLELATGNVLPVESHEEIAWGTEYPIGGNVATAAGIDLSPDDRKLLVNQVDSETDLWLAEIE